ncbi:MAG TPA: SRPBCC family protein [bacterium]|jgi:uncharacterized protein YndB with AHSA1/START domain
MAENVATDNALTVTLPSDREVVMTRSFDAPRDLVFKAYVDPDLIPQWWGPKIYTTKVEKMDVKPGGTWRFVQRGPDGKEYAFHGTYQTVTPPERIVSTFEFEPMPGHVIIDTITFEEQDKKTILKTRALFQSVQDRDGMLNSGMEQGMAESMDRLAALLAQSRSE